VSTRFFQQTITVLASASDTNGVLGAVEVAGPSGATDPRNAMSRLAAVAARYGVEFLGPPGSQT
jgi:hypothetical protein